MLTQEPTLLQGRRTQEERSAMSDQRMLAAAISLIVELGLAGTTLAAIGERAGYSRGLVTHRYGSKARLFGHVHDTVMADWIGRVQAAVGDSVGIAALNRVVDVLLELLQAQPDEIRAMYLLRYASIDPSAEFRANVARAHKAQRRDVQRWIEGGQKAGDIGAKVDAELAAELFCSAVDGIIYRWLVNPRLAIGELHALLKREVARAYGAARKS
jgi:AcrR family transcriptional regulator